MVDFKKKRLSASSRKSTVPSEIYDRLDRASDKGPLRAAQERVLSKWNAERRSDPDVILKLHTGQGKTLIGLLMLQSKLNEEEGRAIYLCPNSFLVGQTLQQAKQFGIACVAIEEDGSIPSSFLEGKAILVATVQKVFNGLTKFGLGQKSLAIDYVVLDDAHACIDSIRAACLIDLQRSENAYNEIVGLFEEDLRRQGSGSFAEIQNSKDDSQGPILPVPYWSWMERENDVARILTRNIDSKQIKFAWPLIRDRLKYCQCLVSGRQLSISPILPPLDLFGSYGNAKHRIFMSATVTDDAFLIKGLGLRKEVVQHPLVDPNETWSGERMILIPSITSFSLDEGFIVSEFGKKNRARKFNVVALTPSFARAKGWEAAGAVVATTDTIEDLVAQLRKSVQPEALAIANRYDGIDLPDDACRLLVLDGLPYGETLWERFVDETRAGSDVSMARMARTIEQGLGRAVRGEKDYCVVLVTSADLVRVIRSREMKRFLSDQTKAQVELGIQISEEAQEDVESADPPFNALRSLMEQCLDRNDDWKEYYKETMDSISVTHKKSDLLGTFSEERQAEHDFQLGREMEASERLQRLIDNTPKMPPAEKGWYLQEMARYEYFCNRTSSVKKQASAHKQNRLLLKPESVVIAKLNHLSQKRSSNIAKYLADFSTDEEATLAIQEILANLKFGVRAEVFERAWQDLGLALGFASERPDKEWKEGPDNLWALRAGHYLLVECKSEVEPTRAQINKDEAGQMNNSCAWFEREYQGCSSINIMIIPTSKITSAAGFNKETRVMKKRDLNKFVYHVSSFFKDVLQDDRRDLDEARIHALLSQYKLGIDDLAEQFTSLVS